MRRLMPYSGIRNVANESSIASTTTIMNADVTMSSGVSSAMFRSAIINTERLVQAASLENA
ncbi:MAG TPA: hypothetical protein VK569_07460, partial [Bacteroidota bacterium]|nr:hypothetical protein [Bacteroidota bacterium]